MSRAFIAPQSVPDPFMIGSAASGQITVTTAADIFIPAWPDTTPQTIRAGTQAISAYGGVSVDNTVDNYLIVLLEGQDAPRLVKEKDRAAIDSVLAGTFTWGAPWMIVNGQDYPTPQF